MTAPESPQPGDAPDDDKSHVPPLTTRVVIAEDEALTLRQLTRAVYKAGMEVYSYVLDGITGLNRALSLDHGAGDMDARGVAVQQAKVAIAGSGSVAAHVSSTADVSIVGAGDVDVTGGAKCSVHKLGAGDVRCS